MCPDTFWASGMTSLDFLWTSLVFTGTYLDFPGTFRAKVARELHEGSGYL
jgi:hypothetical protein